MVVHTGPDYVIVDWDRSNGEGEGGWEAEYTITIVPVGEAGEGGSINMTSNGTTTPVARVVTVTTTSTSPVRVAGLEPETDYEVRVETRLGPHFTSTVKVDDVRTAANDSRMPREIIGVRKREREKPVSFHIKLTPDSKLQYSMVGIEYRAAQLSVLSVQVVMVILAMAILLLSGTM